MLEPEQIFAHRYRVIRQIAEGGMGAIFEAEHVGTERHVALKLLFPHIMSMASARKKFELEAKISARVNSPYIVEVIDAGFDEGTRSPFLVMELLEGKTISDYVESRGALTADEALPLLEQVADGLDAAHSYSEGGVVKPIVHRDLKPDNLFMSLEHGSSIVKILDFGIAKVLGETSNVSQEVRGTPLYMATEQITAGELSPQTDVWALGLIAYYMLTGENYWRSANKETANVQSLFAEILSLPIEAPTVRVREQGSKVALPPGFDTWFAKCVDRAPTRRFDSAGLAVEELARAFRRTPRRRARPSTRAVQPFAATQAVGAPSVDLGGAKNANTKKANAATAASLPGMASEHQGLTESLAGLPTPVRRKTWVAAAAGVGLLVAGAAIARLAASPSAPSAEADGPAVAQPADKVGFAARPASQTAPATSDPAASAPAPPSVRPVGDKVGAVVLDSAKPAPTAPEGTSSSDKAPVLVDSTPAAPVPSTVAVPSPPKAAAPKPTTRTKPKSRRRVRRPRPAASTPAAPTPAKNRSASDAYRLR